MTSGNDDFFRTATAPGGQLRPLMSVLEALTVSKARGPILALLLVRDALATDQETRLNAVKELIRRLGMVEALSKAFLSNLAVVGRERGLVGTPTDILAQLPAHEQQGLVASYDEQVRLAFQ